MATSLIDLLTRRARSHLMDARSTLKAAPRVTELVAPILGWDDAECTRQLGLYDDMVRHDLSRAGLAV
jgi:glycerol-3-phosphate dehydrogenase